MAGWRGGWKPLVTLGSCLAPSLLWCCTGCWASQAPQAHRSAWRKSHWLSGRHTAAIFLFQKTAQHAARSVRVIRANLERKSRELRGAPEQPRVVSGCLGHARLSQLRIAAPLPAALTTRSYSCHRSCSPAQQQFPKGGMVGPHTPPL